MIKDTATSRAYDRRLTKRVRRALASGANTLPEVMAHLPGVFPLLVKAKLYEAGHVFPEAARKRRQSLKILPADFLLPHPLDFDWRFARSALVALRRTIERTRPDAPPIYCFGCPSAAKFFREEAQNAQVQLFDANGPLHETGTVSWNVNERNAPVLTPGVVVADPPWYPRHFRQFLWAIHQACGVGTDVFFAGPPVDTRPSVQLEMRRLFAWGRKLGFEVVSHQVDALPYVMPLFELNTLNAFGVCDVPMDWRRADLWHLKIKSMAFARRPVQIPGGARWEERRFGSVRVRIRTDLPRTGRVSLVPLGRNGFLGSVSSRDPLRQKATVVTSGGRFFSCENPLGFIRSKISMPASKRASGKWSLARLVQVEKQEAARYYELVRKINGC